MCSLDRDTYFHQPYKYPMFKVMHVQLRSLRAFTFETHCAHALLLSVCHVLALEVDYCICAIHSLRWIRTLWECRHGRCAIVARAIGGPGHAMPTQKSVDQWLVVPRAECIANGLLRLLHMGFIPF